MIIVADGGSTKVDWAFIENNRLIHKIQTAGANPIFRTSEDIAAELQEKFPDVDNVHSVHFFGSGCINEEKCDVIRKAIGVCLDISPETIEVGSDLLGAAKALCGEKRGIACILGTGSNSGLYDGSKIIENVSPLGYILGDEGSGAVLGKLFVGACLKNQFSASIKENFLKETGLTTIDIIEKVYRGSLPNRFLAGFTPFIKQNLGNRAVYELVAISFEEFFRRNVMQYDYENNPIYFTGSIAFHFQEVLAAVAENVGLKISNIVASPIEGLISYYSKK